MRKFTCVADIGDLAAAVFRERGGGGVVAGGDQVDAVDLFAAAKTFEVGRFHALIAAPDGDEFDAEHGGGRLDAGISVVVHGDLFAAAEQRGEDGRDRGETFDVMETVSSA